MPERCGHRCATYLPSLNTRAVSTLSRDGFLRRRYFCRPWSGMDEESVRIVAEALSRGLEKAPLNRAIGVDDIHAER